MNTELTTTDNAPAPLALSIFSTAAAFDQAQRAAKLLAASDLLPKQFQGNMPNCVVAMEMANRIGASPFAVFQNLYVVHGRPGWSAQFLIAMVNQSGRFSPLQFRLEGEGKARSCVAYATSKATGETVEGPAVSIEMAHAEGWYGKTGSKWQTMPDVMLRYRAASFFAKFYCPDITMGMQSREELEDMTPQERDVTPRAVAVPVALEPAPEPKPSAVKESSTPAAPAVTESEPEVESAAAEAPPAPKRKSDRELLLEAKAIIQSHGFQPADVAPVLRERGIWTEDMKWGGLDREALIVTLAALPEVCEAMKSRVKCEVEVKGGEW